MDVEAGLSPIVFRRLDDRVLIVAAETQSPVDGDDVVELTLFVYISEGLPRRRRTSDQSEGENEREYGCEYAYIPTATEEYPEPHPQVLPCSHR
jgi:hypothetical protein